MGGVMKRPEKVQDAIELHSEGHSIGFYGDHILRAACQPIYSVGKDRVARLVAYEGLIRPERNGLSLQPEPFFEQVNQADKLFVECLCTELHIRGYRNFRPVDREIFVNVNVANFDTIKSLETEIFYTLSRLEANGLNNQQIVFEILETEVYSIEVLTRICEIFRSNNIRFALDDFGTKSSNIDRFLAVKPGIVKIDRALFHDFLSNRETASLLKSLITAFRDNGAAVLMEGLETEHEALRAVELGVDLMQGFYLGMPKFLPGDFALEIDFGSNVHAQSLRDAV